MTTVFRLQWGAPVQPPRLAWGDNGEKTLFAAAVRGAAAMAAVIGLPGPEGTLPDPGDLAAPTDAVFVDDDTGEVVQVARNKWADERETMTGGTWKDAPAGAVTAGMIEQDGTFAAPARSPRDAAAEVAAYAIALKVGAINAMRTDGGPPYPPTAESLAAAKDRYRDIVDDYNSAVAVGDPVTEEQTATVRLIRLGYQFTAAVDAAAALIIAAGDAADPVSSDDRWPALPSAG